MRNVLLLSEGTILSRSEEVDDQSEKKNMAGIYSLMGTPMLV